MPIYRINGKTVKSAQPLSDEEIDEIAGSIGAAPEQAQSKPSTPAPQAPSQPGAIQSFAEHFGPTAAFAHPGDLARDTGNYLGGVTPGELGAAFLTPKVPIQLAKDAYNASSSIAEDQFNKMREAYEGGDTLEAAARAALGIIGSFPGTSGAVAAGEKLADPETRAGGVGAALGELANVALPFLAKPVARGVAAGGNRLGSALEANAQARYLDALNPKARYQGLAQKVAPEALDRGIWGTSQSLQEAAQAELGRLGPELEALYEQSPARVNVAEAARGPLSEFGRSEVIGGQEQGVRSLQQAAQEELARLQATGEAGELPVAEAWRLRQIKEEPAVRRGAYLPDADPQLSARIEAQGTTADALRSALEEAVPETAPLNREYSFNARLKTLLENKKKSGNKLGGLARAGVAGIAGAPFGVGLPAAIATQLVEYIYNSTAFKTGSAVLQNKIAKALKSGNVPEAVKLAGITPEEIQTLKLQEEPLDLGAFESPRTPELPQPEPLAPQIWGDEVPPGFDIPEAQAQRLLSEFQEAGFEPDTLNLEGLADPDLARLAAADRKAVEIVMRTIQNPTYQQLPIQAGAIPTKTRADVLRNIFARYRSQQGF